MCASKAIIVAFKAKAAFTSAIFAFKSKAVCAAIEIGFIASAVLSTLPNPKFARAA